VKRLRIAIILNWALVLTGLCITSVHVYESWWVTGLHPPGGYPFMQLGLLGLGLAAFLAIAIWMTRRILGRPSFGVGRHRRQARLIQARHTRPRDSADSS